MRVRKKKHTDTRLAAHEKLIAADPASMRGRWREGTGSVRLSLEIGCGKGDFVCGMAKRHPDESFVAMEKVSDVIVTAVEKSAESGIDNARFIIGDAEKLCEYFSDGEVDAIYLNFSDPWKKRYQHKYRLTHPRFLAVYKKILADGGYIYIKTDNNELFEYSLRTLADCGFTPEGVTRDLHGSEFAEGNIMTEYERNFTSQGVKINRAAAEKTEKNKTEA